MNRKSFTIVEIMVVMAVIGIIMTLSIVGIQAAQRQQRVTTITNDMNQFKLALASYYSEYRQYPYTTNEIVFDSANNEICLVEPNTGNNETNCNNVASKVATIKLSQPGVHVSPEVYEFHYTPCSSAEAIAFGGLSDQEIVIPSPEQWVLDYRIQDSSRSQAYKIRFCTEDGPTEFLSQ